MQLDIALLILIIRQLLSPEEVCITVRLQTLTQICATLFAHHKNDSLEDRLVKIETTAKKDQLICTICTSLQNFIRIKLQQQYNQEV